MVRSWNTLIDMEQDPRRLGHSAPVQGISFRFDGMQAVSGAMDNTVRLWNTQTRSQIRIPLEGHTEDVNCVSFSPDGLQVVSGSDDKTFRSWDIETLAQVANPFRGHADFMCCISFSSDGRRIISGGEDKTIRIWNVETQKQLGSPLSEHNNRLDLVAESSGGRFLVSKDRKSDEEGETVIWNRNSTLIVWRSNEDNGHARHMIDTAQAESIIRSCGEETPLLWPNTLPEYIADLYRKRFTPYSNVTGEKILLGNLPSAAHDRCNDSRKVIVAALASGAVAVCRLAVHSL